ncbi:acyl carrier protein [Allocatelliglobosispora scoriae]|uniref:Acyl carrier protein n=1 Tax=Allocatelliglobosispora scoriae TaxID=643052 RepID=A0A841BIN9_9ACTN|nr:acyl carrier protein [Allocatelliglobosispora scoriae]MBB5866923.1 acyl carrier protein [Allocatelliglobosispora scoriae]
MDRVYEHLATVLADKFEASAEEIQPQSTLEELGLDSLAVIELHLTLKEHWDIPLDDSGTTAQLTVDDVARSVQILLDRAAVE